MGFQDAIRSFIRRYTDFQGRSSRSEYWWVVLGELIVALPLAILMQMQNVIGMLATALYVIFFLAIFVGGLALSFRRMHDTDKSAWFLLLALIPFIGGLVLLVFFVLPGTSGPNKFGPDPLGSPAETFT